MQRDEGEIYINGYSIDKNFEKAMAKVGGIVENPETYTHLTGLENLQQYARMRDGVTRERIDEVVRMVGLENRIHDKVKKYSLGMKQRLGVAQSIMHHPDLLVLDEPTNGLDPAGIKELRDILKHLAHEENICVMVSSHLLSEMQLMCDRVGIIVNGKIIDVKGIDDLVRESEGNHFVYHIKVLENLEQAMSLIDDKEISEVSQDTFAVTLDDERAVADIVTRLVLNQVKVLGVTAIKRNLEDIFIELTGSGGGMQID